MVHDIIFSPLSLYNYDNSIFDLFRVPEGVDREVTRDAILLETCELSTIYTTPEKFKLMIGLWVSRYFEVWEKLYATTQFEYNPIHNYDRTEEGEDKLDGKNKQTRNLNDSSRNHTAWEDSTHERKGAFNNGLADSYQTDRNGTSDVTGNLDQTGTVDDKTDNIMTHKLRAFGNIGVTTTQEMIAQERESVEFNLIDYIVDSFKRNFCVMVY